MLNFVLMFLFEVSWKQLRNKIPFEFCLSSLSKEYIIENDHISFKRAPLSSTSRNKNARTGTHHLHIENLLRLTPDWPPILATPSEEEKIAEHVLVNENKTNNQPTTTTNECFWTTDVHMFEDNVIFLFLSLYIFSDVHFPYFSIHIVFFFFHLYSFIIFC